MWKVLNRSSRSLTFFSHFQLDVSHEICWLLAWLWLKGMGFQMAGGGDSGEKFLTVPSGHQPLSLTSLAGRFAWKIKFEIISSQWISILSSLIFCYIWNSVFVIILRKKDFKVLKYFKSFRKNVWNIRMFEILRALLALDRSIYHREWHYGPLSC